MMVNAVFRFRPVGCSKAFSMASIAGASNTR
jgi:hypothetical protein